MQVLFKFYVSNDVRIFCKRLHSHDCLTEITQPVKSHIDFCFTLSCKWSHLLKSHVITYIKTVFYNSKSIHPISMNFCAYSLNCRIGQNTTWLFIQIHVISRFRVISDSSFRIFVGVANKGLLWCFSPICMASIRHKSRRLLVIAVL